MVEVKDRCPALSRTSGRCLHPTGTFNGEKLDLRLHAMPHVNSGTQAEICDYLYVNRLAALKED